MSSRKLFQIILSLVILVHPLELLALNFADMTVVYPLLAPRISSGFGNRTHPVRHYVKHHSGVDLAAPANSHVRAIATGTIVYADKFSAYGKLVTIAHKDGYTSHYGHLSIIDVKVGQIVSAGQIIGRVGSTGLTTGPHLHFEWRNNGHAMNPLHTFPELAAKAEG